MTQSELKELKAIGAELGAAKAEVERLREALQAMLDECDPMNLNCGEPWCRARAALLPRSEPCGGCGNDDESKRCIGCGHHFTPAPTDTYTAVDMATAAAQGFRDGQAAMELVGYQFQGRDGAWNSFMDQRHYENTLDDGTWPIRAIYTPTGEQDGKFAMHQRVRKTSGSEWQGRICGTYSTELTPEGYAVESEAHAGSVQIYPAKALEAVE